MTDAPSGPLIMIAEFTIQPDKVEAFLAYTAENLHLSRSYPGNVSFDVLRDQTRPEKVLFYEVWESLSAQQAYMAWRGQAEGFDTLLSFLAKPPKFTPYRRASD